MGGKGNEKEERSGKFQAAQERNAGQRFFHGLFVSFLMMLTMGSGMGKCEEENYSLKKQDDRWNKRNRRKEGVCLKTGSTGTHDTACHFPPAFIRSMNPISSRISSSDME